MKGRSLLLRIRKAEELLAAARVQHRENVRRSVPRLFSAARRHAVLVAAIVLAGRPRIDQPLKPALLRALQHFGIHTKTLTEANEAEIADQLLPIILGDEKASDKFTEIFRTAPVWLLHFTRVALDARLLNFRLPPITTILTWGTRGYEDAHRWPLLPVGTMAAGDPIPKTDLRWIWIVLTSMVSGRNTIHITEDTILSALDEQAEFRSARQEDPFIEDLIFAADLKTPEKEWSAYERRRMRRFSRQISLPSEKRHPS